jgi:ankyrin repeat protein
VDAVKVLLAYGANVNAREPFKGQTALMFAASEGNTAAAAMLLEFGAQIKAKSTKGYTALLFAVRNAHIDTVETLLAHGANVNDVAPDGTTALNMAVLNAYFELASVLLDHGANPNAPDARGSALHTLAWLRKPGSDGAVGVGQLARSTPVPVGKTTALELAKALLQHGANPNARIAWREGKFDPEGGRARNPVDINIGRHFLSYVGATPFYIAARSGDAPMMRVLADGGADPKLGTEAGITPLMVAAGLDAWPGESPGPFTGVSEAERLEAVKLAVDLGNDVNAHSDFAPFPMEGDAHYTLLYYPLNMPEVADKGLGDPRWTGCTPLISAVVSDQPSIVQYLVDHGAKLDAQTKLGWTPLMVAERGVFFANSKKDYPRAAEIIRKAMIEHGLLAAGQATDTASDSAAPSK